MSSFLRQVELPFTNLLPPGFRLHAVCKAACSIRERKSANKSAQPTRPIRVRHECPQDRTAEEFSSRSNLWSDREFAQPPVIGWRDLAVGVIESPFERQGEILREKNLWPRAERDPLLPWVLRVHSFCALVDENRHDGKSFVWLNHDLFGDQKPSAAVDEPGWVVNGCAEITRGPGSILNAKQVVTAVPLESLMAYSECVAVAGRNQLARRSRAAFAGSEIEPHGRRPARSLYVVKTHVDVAFEVVAVFCRNVGSCTRQKPERQLAGSHIQILNPRAVTAHIQGKEIVDVNLLTTVIPLAGPKLGIWLAFKNISRLDESLSQAKLVITKRIVETCVAGRVRGVSLDHCLGLNPCLVGTPLGVYPIVDEYEFAVGFGFVSQSVLSPGAGRRECNLLPTLAVKTVSGAEISVEFKSAYLLFQAGDLALRLLQQVIGGFRWQGPLVICSDLTLSEYHFPRFLGGKIGG